jgi:hypothetical protein
VAQRFRRVAAISASYILDLSGHKPYPDYS